MTTLSIVACSGIASTPELLGANLIEILNQLGSEGWEVVGVGDLMFDARTEIVLKRSIA